MAPSRNTRDNVYRYYGYRGPIRIIPLGIRIPSYPPATREELLFDAAPPGISGGETALLSKALEDFRYQGLDIDVDGKVYGELNIRMHIRGSNPELYDGYPIELNVGLEGALGKLLQQGLVGYRIPESIQRRFSMPSE